MRITYLHQYFVTPEMAGGARSYEMARRLVAMGHEVDMITSDQHPPAKAPVWRETTEAGIRVHWTPVPYDNKMGYARRLRAFFSFAWRAARKAATMQGDVVFATSTPLTIALPAVWAARRLRRPMVFEVRDLWPAVPIAIGAIRHPLAKAAARRLERFAYRHAAHVVALAPGMGEEVIRNGYPRERVTIIPNGCDRDFFSGEHGGGEIRSSHEWLNERPLLLFTGTFGLVNGMDYLVLLAREIARLDPQVRIVAIGTGRAFDDTRAMARELGVLDRSLFLLGQKPKSELAAWMQAADMTIALFTGPEIVWRDAVQNKFFDSLAAGKPVANNFRGWQATIAEEAGAGIILSADDHVAAARDVVRALRDRDWQARARSAALRLAEQRFDRDLLAAKLARVLETVALQSAGCPQC